MENFCVAMFKLMILVTVEVSLLLTRTLLSLSKSYRSSYCVTHLESFCYYISIL